MHFKRIKSYGYIDRIITVDDLISKSTHDLFNKMCIPSHHLLPDHHVSDNLRLRGHEFQLPTHCTVLHRNSSVTRSLFLYVWFVMCVCLIISNKRLFKVVQSSRPCCRYWSRAVYYDFNKAFYSTLLLKVQYICLKDNIWKFVQNCFK